MNVTPELLEEITRQVLSAPNAQTPSIGPKGLLVGKAGWPPLCAGLPVGGGIGISGRYLFYFRFHAEMRVNEFCGLLFKSLRKLIAGPDKAPS